jgi:hypothetical protein
MENSGTTPTREALHHVSWVHSPTPIPDGFDLVDMGDPTVTPFVIGPKQVLSTGAMQIPPEILEAVRNHRDRVYLWGWATYRDVFKATPEHITIPSLFCTQTVVAVARTIIARMTSARARNMGCRGAAGQIRTPPESALTTNAISKLWRISENPSTIHEWP